MSGKGKRMRLLHVPRSDGMFKVNPLPYPETIPDHVRDIVQDRDEK
jgi:hypothetical protein